MTPARESSGPPHTRPPSLCVADANILFDLRNGDILLHLTALPYRFIVPDAVFAEVLDAQLRTTLQEIGFEIGELTPASVGELFALRSRHPRLSVPDLFAFFVARDRWAMLLTGDERLRKLAEARGLMVHGILWVLDELVERQVLGSGKAWAALERIVQLGAHLPEAEIQRRRRKWL